MTPVAVADMLERYAARVLELPGVSRTRPHVFAESKSELAGEMFSEARRLRTMSAPRASTRQVAEIRLGSRDVDGRSISVERRRRAG